MDYEALKTIIDSLKINTKNSAAPLGTSTEQSSLYTPRAFVDFYDDTESQAMFHRVSSSDLMGMVSTDGSDLEEQLLGRVGGHDGEYAASLSEVGEVGGREGKHPVSVHSAQVVRRSVWGAEA